MTLFDLELRFHEINFTYLFYTYSVDKPRRITKPIDFLYRRFNRCWTVEDMNTVSKLMLVEAEKVVETESAREANRVLNIMDRVLLGLKAYE